MLRKLICSTLLLASLASADLRAAPPSQVEVKTNRGTFVIELYADKAPKTVANFLEYVKDGFFKGTVFHRVVPGFVIQGGGFDADLRQRPNRAPIENEAANGLRNERGTLSMARTRDPQSATSQFFVNLVDNVALDYRSATPSGYGYAVFAKVVKGMDVIDAIGAAPTQFAGGMENVPSTAIVIERACVLGTKPC